MFPRTADIACRAQYQSPFVGKILSLVVRKNANLNPFYICFRPSVYFPLDSPKAIDLLQLQGTLTSVLLVDSPIGVGHYDEIRLLVDNAPMANHARALV